MEDGFCGWTSESYLRWRLVCGPYSVKACKRILNQYHEKMDKRILPIGVTPFNNGGQNGRSEKRARAKRTSMLHLQKAAE